jgi:kinesin family member 3B
VKQLSIHVVKDVDSINQLLDVGMKNRAVGSTKMNDVSSRSHALF